MDSITSAEKHVYLASPIGTYHTPRYDRMLAHAGRHFPDASILPARGLYRDVADFKRRWPRLLPTLSALAFFADEAGYIGYGVWTEIRDMRRRGLPVWFLTDDGALYAWEAVRFGVPDEQDWRRYLRVTLGKDLVPA